MKGICGLACDFDFSVEVCGLELEALSLLGEPYSFSRDVLVLC